MPRAGGAQALPPMQVARARRQAEDRYFWLRGPQARQDRARSRTQFRGRLALGRARGVAVSRFRRLVTGPLWTQPRLNRGERRTGMRGDRVMLVNRDGRPSGVVDSAIPLVATTQDGTSRPTDVSLVAGPEDFRSRNPVVRSVISKRLGDGIVLPDDGLALLPQMAGANAVGSAAQDRVFYANAARDTDVIAGATPTGAAIYYQLRSPASPRELVLSVRMPAGAWLRAAPNGLGPVEVVTQTEKLASITPPIAIDAQGQTVPARYAIAGDRIRITVDHTAGDFAYPILVDPAIDGQSTWRSNPNLPILAWQYSTPWPWFFPSYTDGPHGRGLYIYTTPGAYYGHTADGWWTYRAPGEAFIYRADFIGLRHQPAQGQGPTCLTTGIYNTRSGDWQRNHGTWQLQRGGAVVADWRTDGIPRVSCLGMTDETYILWTHPQRAESGEPSNMAAVDLWAYGNGTRSIAGHAYMAGSVIHMSDSQNPTINGGPPATATDPDQTWSFSFIDQGLGSYKYLIDEPGNPDWDQTKVQWLSCYAVSWSPCPTGWQTVTAKVGNLTPGTHTIRLQVWDGGNKVTQAFRTVNVSFAYPTSVRYGGSNYVIDTDSEIDSAIAAIGVDSASWDGLSPEDMATLAAADAYVAWGESPPDDDPADAPQGTWTVSSSDAPVPDDFFPSGDIIETYPDDGSANQSVAPWVVPIVVGGCLRFCDDAARGIFRGGRGGLRKVRRPRPQSWRQLRPDAVWVRLAGRNPSRKLNNNMPGIKPTGYHAHHIIPAGARYARKAQAILARCGFDPNDARNGVYLPASEAARRGHNPADPRPLHGQLHTQWYYHNINEIVSKNYYSFLQSGDSHGTRCARAVDAVVEIGNAIRMGKFPH
jgi:A nuclease family of the HNH/ENDO VII superfamily with conserved AHH